MAVSVSFKQQCPSCEALVPVKDTGMIGKKIDCPKCKYKFVVEKPAANGAAKDRDTKLKEDKKTKTVKEEDTKETVKADKTKEAVKAGKPKTKMDNGKAAENDAVPTKANGKAVAAKSKGPVRDAAEDDGAEKVEADGEEAPPTSKKKKGKAGSQKMMVGLGLAAVGLIVLAVAGFFLLNKKPPASTSPAGGTQVAGGNSGPPPQPDGNGPPEENKDNKDNIKKPQVQAKPAVEEPRLPGAGAETTNLVPPDSEHLLHVFLKNVFHPQSPLREPAFAPGAFVDEEFKQKLGIAALAVDDLIRAQRFTAPAWSFTVAHTIRRINEDAVVKALDLQPVKGTIKGQKYFVAKQRIPWLEEMGRLSFGAPDYLRWLETTDKKERPVYVHVHNPQTIIFADQIPMLAFLEAEGRFKYQTDVPKAAPAETKPAPATNSPMGPGKNPMPMGTTPMPMPKSSTPMGTSPMPMDKGSPMPMDKGSPMPMDKGGSPMPMGKGSPMPMDKGSPMPMPQGTATPNAPPAPAPAAPVNRSGTYMTVAPHLKELLDRMESRPADSKDRVLYSSATDMDAARLQNNDPEFQDRYFWQFRQLWDVSNLLQQKRRIRYLGASLHQKASKIYRFKNEIQCTDEVQTALVHKDLVDLGSPRVAQFIDRMLGHKVELPTEEKKAEPKDQANPKGFPPGMAPPGKSPMAPGGAGGKGGFPQPGFPMQPNQAQPEDEPPEDDEPKVSRMRVNKYDDDSVEFILDLVLDQTALQNLNKAIDLVLIAAKNRMDLAGRPWNRYDLARAARELGLKGLSDRGVPPGRYPAGAFKRQDTNLRSALEPSSRVSWMAGLLPYLNRKELYDRIDFNLSWKDPSNWLAARSVVPEFVDPMYPFSARFVTHTNIPFDVGATHFVGIAGVGMDAADYPLNDPSFDLKRGVLSYEGSRAVKDVQDNHGASNTILLIQVPHDGPAGVTPWLAGGGSTLRGVPEKNSVAPFVLSNDRHGKPIQYNGKRGTFAAMVDGSVRFIDEKISDEVFKAMCTVKGPAPANNGVSEWAPVEPAPLDDGQRAPLPTEKAEKTKNDKKPAAQKEPAVEKAKPVPAGLRQDQLKQLGLAYHSHVGAMKRPPANAKELAPFFEKDAKLMETLTKGEYIILWKSSFENMTAGTSNTILGYEKETPTAGGLVLMADASVRNMTAEEFKKAPKGAGK